ncbi:MAG: DUF6053 domain-containing protein [Lysobacter sp.]
MGGPSGPTLLLRLARRPRERVGPEGPPAKIPGPPGDSVSLISATDMVFSTNSESTQSGLVGEQ